MGAPGKQKKQRLDVLLVERGLAETRSQAQAMIMAGEVRANDQVLSKPGQTVSSDIDLTVVERARYVGRGGDKLASVADQFKLEFTGKVVIDVGSSTGGFTDYALQNGAKKVYAIDVGTGQLAYKLRQDPRVVVMERTDIRDVLPPMDENSSWNTSNNNAVEVYGSRSAENSLKNLPELADYVVGDLSFISVNKILVQCSKLLLPKGIIIILIKPQFEAGRAIADKFSGVISDDSVRNEIIDRVRAEIEQNFQITGEADSGVAGADGNRERFFLLEPKR